MGNSDLATLGEALDPKNGEPDCCRFHKTAFALLRDELDRVYAEAGMLRGDVAALHAEVRRLLNTDNVEGPCPACGSRYPDG